MPSQNATAVNLAGLSTFPNPFGPNMPAGGLLVANNVRADHPGSLAARPGQTPMMRFGDPANAVLNLSSWLTAVANWNWFYQLGSGLFPSWTTSANAWEVLGTDVLNQTISTTSAPQFGIDPSLFTTNVNTPTARGIAWNTNAYINLKNGVARVQVSSDSAIVTPAGLPQAPPVIAALIDSLSTTNSGATQSYASGTTYSVPVNGSAISTESVAAYQLLWMSTDYDNTILLGPPSVQVQVNNTPITPTVSGYTGFMNHVASTPCGAYTLSISTSNFSGYPFSNYCAPVLFTIPGVDSWTVGIANFTALSTAYVALDPGYPLLNLGGIGSQISCYPLYSISTVSTDVTSSTVTVTFVGVGGNNTYVDPANFFSAIANLGFVSGTPSTNVIGARQGWGAFATHISFTATSFTATFTIIGGASTFTPGQWAAFYNIYDNVNATVTSAQTDSLVMQVKAATVSTLSNYAAPLLGDTLLIPATTASTFSVLSGSFATGSYLTTSGFSFSYGLDQFPAGLQVVPYGFSTTAGATTVDMKTNGVAAVLAAWEALLTGGTVAPFSISNLTWSGPRNVLLQLPYDQWLHNVAHTVSSSYVAYSYQLYRSVQNPTVSSDGTIPQASQDASLLMQALLPTTATTGTTTLLTYFDQTPESALGAALYTSSAQGGALQAQFPPPPCADLCLFNNVMIYANFADTAAMSLQLVGVSNTATSTSFQQLQPGDKITLTYTPSTSEVPMSTTLTAGTTFALVTNQGPSSNLNGTVVNLCNAINAAGLFSPKTGSVIAFPNLQFGLTGEPGLFDIAVTQGLGSITLSFTPSVSSNPSPFVGGPTSGVAAPTFLPSEFAYAQANIPGGVPLLANTNAVGTTTYPIRRIVTCQSGTFIFKDDGIFQLSGEYGAYNVQILSTTAWLVANNTAVVLQDSVFCLTTDGVVIVNGAGVNIASQAIREDLLKLLKLSSVKYAFAVADQQRSHYMLWMCSAANLTVPDTCFIYNALNNSWVTDSTTRQVGAVDLESGTLFMGAVPGTEQIGLVNCAQVITEYAEGATPTYVQEADDVWGGFSLGTGSTTSSFVLTQTLVPTVSTNVTSLAQHLGNALAQNYFLNGAVFVSDVIPAFPVVTMAGTTSVNSAASPPTILVTISVTTSSQYAPYIAELIGYPGMYISAPIPVTWQCIIGGDDPGHVKTFQEFTVQARNCSQLTWSTSQSSDFGSSIGYMKLRGYNPGAYAGTPAQVGWAAATAPITTAVYASARNFVAKNVSKGHVLFTTFTANVAATAFEITAITFNWNGANSTAQR